MLKYLILFLGCLSGAVQGIAQPPDSLLINQLVEDIASAQVGRGDKDFYAGMFRSYRENGGYPHNYQPDNNLFFTAISVLALKKMLPNLSSANQARCRQIIDSAILCYPFYQNKYGYPFYNFWPTDKVIMPHTTVFKYLKNIFGQGEDADDSVMALLGMEDNTPACLELKARLMETSNLSRKKIIATYKKYRNIPAYSTWIGYRMPVDFDFAVHCNILYFVLEKKLPLARQDSATVYLLSKMIENREYMEHPVYTSPYYVHPPVLLYHIARLLGRFSISMLDVYKPQLVKDIHAQLLASTNIMDHIILRTALLRLGAPAPALPLYSVAEFEHSNQQQFVFFQARAAFSYPSPFKQIFLQWSYIYYRFYCPVYNKVLWLEYLVEKNKIRG